MASSAHSFTRHASLPHLEMRTARDARDCYLPHTHEEYAFGAIDAGHAIYRHGEQQVALRPGMTVMMEPGLAHACNPSQEKPWSYRMLYVNAAWVHQSFMPFDAHAEPRRLALARHHSSAPGIYRALDGLMTQLAGEPDALAVEEKMLFFLEQHVLIPRGLAGVLPQDSPGLDAVRDCLHAQPECKLSLAQLAHLSGLDGFQLIRQFKQAFGQTPHAYQIDLRLNRAKQLLRQGEPLSDVAHRLGFADQAHFQRQFKQRHATTPKNYMGIPPTPRHA
jgi:AraC-like DNA-binding protein